MSKLRVLDLFSGIGGFSLGLERTGGFETVAFCEIEPFVVTGEYALDIFVPPSLRDVDNHCAKAVSDLLVELQVTPDDKFARRSATEVVETLSEIHVIVRPWDAVPRLADQFAFPMQMEGKR